jgi:glucose-1-phosphate thymidylyltransferase
MKCLILAAGYATRLYPLTENFPKPLLKVGDKTILDWLIDDIDTAGLVDAYVVISNHKFAPIFEAWAAARCPVAAGHDGGVAAGHDGGGGTEHDDPLRHARPDRASRITVLDDGTSTNDTRLGAVRDIQFAIDTLGLDEDLLVIAGDNLLDFSLVRFIDYAREKGTSCIMRYFEPSEEKLHKTGVAVVDGNDLILEMEEKPAHPKSHWCCPPFYFYRRSDVPLVKVGIDSGCGVDAPGSFIAWLSAQTPVHAWEMPGRRYDIGNLASYEDVKRNYHGIPPESA